MQRRLLFLFGGMVITIIVALFFFRTGVEVKLGRDLKINLSKTQSIEFVWIEDLKMWVGKYEVTFGQYCSRYPSAKLSGTQSRVDKHPDYYVGEENDHPVVMVGWKRAKKYCNWLNRRYRGILPEGYQFRLPTEKEWESFARCGDNRTYPWGNEWPPQRMKDGVYPNYQGEDEWVGKENVSKPKPDTIIYISDGMKSQYKIIPNYRDGWKETCPVQKSGMNNWGLYGVGGNAHEWTETCDPAGLRITKGRSCGSYWPKRLRIVNQTVKERCGGFYIPIPFMTGKNTGFGSSGFRVVIGPKLIGEGRFILYLVLVSLLVVIVSYLLIKRIREKEVLGMNLFKFTELRKRLFINRLIVLLGIPLLCTLIMVVEGPMALFLGPLRMICLPIVMIFFLLPALIFEFLPIYLLGSGVGGSLFEWGIGAGPEGILGWAITIIFYVVLSFLLSSVASLKRTSK